MNEAWVRRYDSDDELILEFRKQRRPDVQQYPYVGYSRVGANLLMNQKSTFVNNRVDDQKSALSNRSVIDPKFIGEQTSPILGQKPTGEIKTPKLDQKSEYMTNSTSDQTLPPRRVDMDFDTASREWMKNKYAKKRGFFIYCCGGARTKQNGKCRSPPYLWRFYRHVPKHRRAFYRRWGRCQIHGGKASDASK